MTIERKAGMQNKKIIEMRFPVFLLALILIVACKRKDNTPNPTPITDQDKNFNLLVNKKWMTVDMGARDSMGQFVYVDWESTPDYMKDDYHVWHENMQYVQHDNKILSPGSTNPIRDTGSWSYTYPRITMNSNDPTMSRPTMRIVSITSYELVLETENTEHGLTAIVTMKSISE